MTAPSDSAETTPIEATRDALRDRIARRLEQPEFAESSLSPELEADDAETKISERLKTQLGEGARARAAVARAQAHFAAHKRRVRGICAVFVLLAIALVAAVAIGLSMSGDNFLRVRRGRVLEVSGSLVAGFLLGALTLLVGARLVWIWFHRASRAARRVADGETRELSATAALERRLDYEVDRQLRLRVRAEGEGRGDIKLTSRAPALVELESADPTDTPDITRLRTLIENVETSALAIAGPRGIGKSTLIRVLTADIDLFDAAAVVPAPVHYDPDALLRRIHYESAMAILRRRGAEDVLGELDITAAQRARSRRFLVAVVSGLTGASLISIDLVAGAFFQGLGTATTLGALFLWASLVVSIISGAGSVGEAGTAPGVVGNAAREVEALRYSVEETQSSKTSLRFTQLFFTTEDADAATRRERERSRPEAVADLANFLRRHLEAQSKEEKPSTGRVAIAVDELDKMASSDDIVATVNSLKDLFRISGVHFVVSVSNDAITRFALRGVATRDVFDSSFDSVIELRRLTCEDAHEVLSARALGWPRALSAIAHAWSGGIPRDLIRVARRCVELRRAHDVVSIDQLVPFVLAEDLVQTLRALRTKAYGEGRSETLEPSPLTSLIDRLAITDILLASTRSWRDVLVSDETSVTAVKRPVRPAVTKVLVTAALTAALTEAVSSGVDDAREPAVYEVADAIARANAARSSPLGEFMVLAETAVSRMRRARMSSPDLTRWPKHSG